MCGRIFFDTIHLLKYTLAKNNDVVGLYVELHLKIMGKKFHQILLILCVEWIGKQITTKIDRYGLLVKMVSKPTITRLKKWHLM